MNSFIQLFYFLPGKKPPTPAITALHAGKNALLEPAEQSIPADADNPEGFCGSIISTTIYYYRHPKLSSLHMGIPKHSRIDSQCSEKSDRKYHKYNTVILKSGGNVSILLFCKPTKSYTGKRCDFT
jgi:hypothetical protein